MNKILDNLDKSKKELAEFFYEYYFQEKPDEFDDLYWIGWDSCLWVWDIFVNLDDIVEIIRHHIPREVFSDWYDYLLEQWYIDEDIRDRVNLFSYAKIRGDGTHENYLSFQKQQERIRATPEHKAQVEAELKKIWDEWLEKLRKYIKSSPQ